MAKLKGLGSEKKTLELKLIGWDDRYQRGVKNHHLYIAENFNKDAAGTLTVALRPDETYWVLDGLQRKTAMERIGIERWKCDVIECDTITYEAELFRLINDKKGRKGLSSRELFKAALTAKDQIAVGVVEVLGSHGLSPALSGGAGRSGHPNVTCLGLLYRMYAQSNGKETLGRAFELIDKMWPGDSEGIHESIIGAMCLLIRQRSFDEDRMLGTVGRKSPKTIRLGAEGAAGSRHAAVADQIIKHYNVKLQARSGNAIRLFADKAADSENGPTLGKTGG